MNIRRIDLKNCVYCGYQLMDGTRMCTRCGATQTPKKSKVPIIIGLIVGAPLFMGLICFQLIICIRIFGESISTQYNVTNDITQSTEGEINIDYQKYEDSYLSYEIPATWEQNKPLSKDSIYLTGFGPSNPATDKSSSISILIEKFVNDAKLANVDFGDKEIQNAFHEYLMSQVGDQLPNEAADGAFSVMIIEEHYVYTLSYEEKVRDSIIHQKIYFPMDFDFTITIYATDWLDEEQPSANQVVEHLIKTLEIK